MPRNSIGEYSTTPGDNTDIGGINIGEGMAPSDVNNAMRELLSQLKEFQTGAGGDTISPPVLIATTATIGTATVTGAATFNSAVVMSSTLTGATISGSANTLTVDGTDAVGFRNIPQNSQSAAYTLVAADAGKHILHPSADTTARTFTIPANSSVPFPIGTAITFINQNGAGVVTIAITTDTMRLSPAGTTGSRTLAANGSATAIKITSTEWIISGSGLT
jgi:hypothetical protein